MLMGDAAVASVLGAPPDEAPAHGPADGQDGNGHTRNGSFVNGSSGRGSGGGRVGSSAGSVWWVVEVPRQVAALMQKNLILARRNRMSTFVRTCSSLFFMLLIFLVNEGLKGRYSQLAYFQDLKDATTIRKEINGIPECVPKIGYTTCITFGYSPAPWNEYVPEADYEKEEDFAKAVKDKGLATCETALGLCSAIACQVAEFQPSHECAKCCEMFRVHKVVRTMMQHNGTAKAVKTSKDAWPIPARKVLGFISEPAIDAFLLENPEYVQGAFIFASPHANATTFVVQHNSTPSQRRGKWQEPVMKMTIPMQVTASKAIATEIIKTIDPNALVTMYEDMHVHMQPFAHPPQAKILNRQRHRQFT